MLWLVRQRATALRKKAAMAARLIAMCVIGFERRQASARGEAGRRVAYAPICRIDRQHLPVTKDAAARPKNTAHPAISFGICYALHRKQLVAAESPALLSALPVKGSSIPCSVRTRRQRHLTRHRTRMLRLRGRGADWSISTANCLGSPNRSTHTPRPPDRRSMRY